MKIFQFLSFHCIKLDAARVVKSAFSRRTRQARFTLAVSGSFILISFAPSVFAANTQNPFFDEVSASPSTDQSNEIEAEFENLPPIEANTYWVNVLKRNNTNRLYLFQSASTSPPILGRILLLKEETEPVMALRILRNYPKDHSFAARRIKRYEDYKVLLNGQSFIGVEKIGDLTLEERRQLGIADDEDMSGSGDESELDELEKETAYDDTIDNAGLIIPEIHPLDQNTHWLAAGFGFIKNNAPPALGGTYYFSAGNVRYGLTLIHRLIFNKTQIQDSIVLDGGAYLYKSLSYATEGDAYTLLALTPTLRYNILFSKGFGIFFYGGWIQNKVISQNQGEATATAALNSNFTEFGTGLLIQVGPSWYTRVDLGMNTIGLNLVLRF